jgi:hypothetical protein
MILAASKERPSILVTFSRGSVSLTKKALTSAPFSIVEPTLFVAIILLIYITSKLIFLS